MMNPKEIKAALAEIRNIVGPKCHVSLAISSSQYGEGAPICGSLYPDGIGYDRTIRVEAATFEAALKALSDAWSSAKEAHERQTIRSMAIEIISITADQGSCSDAALRAGKFSAAEVKKFGDRACAEANEIAGKGPFSIVSLHVAANAA